MRGWLHGRRSGRLSGRLSGCLGGHHSGPALNPLRLKGLATLISASRPSRPIFPSDESRNTHLRNVLSPSLYISHNRSGLLSFSDLSSLISGAWPLLAIFS